MDHFFPFFRLNDNNDNNYDNQYINNDDYHNKNNPSSLSWSKPIMDKAPSPSNNSVHSNYELTLSELSNPPTVSREPSPNKLTPHPSSESLSYHNNNNHVGSESGRFSNTSSPSVVSPEVIEAPQAIQQSSNVNNKNNKRRRSNESTVDINTNEGHGISESQSITRRKTLNDKNRRTRITDGINELRFLLRKTKWSKSSFLDAPTVIKAASEFITEAIHNNSQTTQTNIHQDYTKNVLTNPPPYQNNNNFINYNNYDNIINKNWNINNNNIDKQNDNQMYLFQDSYNEFINSTPMARDRKNEIVWKADPLQDRIANLLNGDCLLVRIKDTIIIDVNTVFERVTGFHRSLVIGKRMTDFPLHKTTYLVPSLQFIQNYAFRQQAIVNPHAILDDGSNRSINNHNSTINDDENVDNSSNSLADGHNNFAKKFPFIHKLSQLDPHSPTVYVLKDCLEKLISKKTHLVPLDIHIPPNLNTLSNNSLSFSSCCTLQLPENELIPVIPSTSDLLQCDLSTLNQSIQNIKEIFGLINASTAAFPLECRLNSAFGYRCEWMINLWTERKEINSDCSIVDGQHGLNDKISTSCNVYDESRVVFVGPAQRRYSKNVWNSADNLKSSFTGTNKSSSSFSTSQSTQNKLDSLVVNAKRFKMAF